MLRIHNNADLEPVSNVEANADQIQVVYAQCFPGRKFKVTPNRTGPTSLLLVQNIGFEKKLTQDLKTYEEPRVQCKECGMEMKTEDRQVIPTLDNYLMQCRFSDSRLPPPSERAATVRVPSVRFRPPRVLVGCESAH